MRMHMHHVSWKRDRQLAVGPKRSSICLIQHDIIGVFFLLTFLTRAGIYTELVRRITRFICIGKSTELAIGLRWHVASCRRHILEL